MARVSESIANPKATTPPLERQRRPCDTRLYSLRAVGTRFRACLDKESLTTGY